MISCLFFSIEIKGRKVNWYSEVKNRYIEVGTLYPNFTIIIYERSLLTTEYKLLLYRIQNCYGK